MRSKKRRKASRIGTEIVAGLAEFRESVERGERVDTKFTVRTVELKLTPAELGAKDVREIRRSLQVSQAVFARILGTSVQCVESWEQGVRKPPPMACRLLELVRDHRDHWLNVLAKARREPTLN